MKCIEFIDIYKTFQNGTIKALDGVNLSVEQGCLFGLVGSNGAGKTTLINILAGLRRQDSGRMLFQQNEILPDAFAYRQLIGFVPEDPLYLDRLTGKEFLQFTGTMYNLNKIDIQSRVDELIGFFNLDDDASRFIETYSKGMKQKISLAAAMIHQPRLLVLDEPFEGLDTSSSEDIKDALKHMVKKGITVIITSHSMELIEALCQECAILHKGNVVFQSQMNELGHNYKNASGRELEKSLKEIFIDITSPDYRKKRLSWL